VGSRQSRALPWIRPERNSPVSMQAQIAHWLEQLIGSGRLGAGDRLPSEATLVERLGVSRVTVRLAIDDLVSRGFVARAHGKGSFVTSPVVQHDILSDQAFFDIVLAKAPKAEVRLLSFASVLPPVKVAALFELPAGRKAMKLERLSLSAGRPVVFSENWLTPDAAHLSPADIENMSTAAVHSVLLRQPIASSTNAIGAELAGATVARRLAIGARSAVLVLTRTRLDAQGQVREHNRFTVDPSAYEFTFSAKGDVSTAAMVRAIAA
jgi:GntR family transcriptional regulator